MSLFCLHFEKYFHWSQKSSLTIWSFSTLKRILLSSTCIVSEKSPVILIVAPRYVIFLFLSLLSFKNFLYHCSLAGYLKWFPFDLSSWLGLWVNVVHQSSYISSFLFSLSFLGRQLYIWWTAFNSDSQVADALLCVLHYFSLWVLFWIISFGQSLSSLIPLSIMFNLLLSPPNKSSVDNFCFIFSISI